jgi:hypothetical protein
VPSLRNGGVASPGRCIRRSAANRARTLCRDSPATETAGSDLHHAVDHGSRIPGLSRGRHGGAGSGATPAPRRAAPDAGAQRNPAAASGREWSAPKQRRGPASEYPRGRETAPDLSGSLQGRPARDRAGPSAGEEPTRRRWPLDDFWGAGVAPWPSVARRVPPPRERPRQRRGAAGRVMEASGAHELRPLLGTRGCQHECKSTVEAEADHELVGLG